MKYNGVTIMTRTTRKTSIVVILDRRARLRSFEGNRRKFRNRGMRNSKYHPLECAKEGKPEVLNRTSSELATKRMSCW